MLIGHVLSQSALYGSHKAAMGEGCGVNATWKREFHPQLLRLGHGTGHLEPRLLCRGTSRIINCPPPGTP